MRLCNETPASLFSKIWLLPLFWMVIFPEMKGQHNEPWAGTAAVPWANNCNGTQFRFWDYFPSISGYNHNGGMAQPSVTAGVTIGGIASCDASVGGRDIWFVIPPSGAASISVRTTLYNYDNTDAIPMRANVYTGTSCTGSGACNLTRVFTHCSSVLNQGGCAFTGSVQFTDLVTTGAGVSVYVQVWADDNDGDASASVYGFTGGSYNSPSNNACTGGINMTVGGSAYAGTNFTANGGDFQTLASQATTCGWNVTDNSVFYYFTPTANSTTFTISDVSCSFTGCDGNSAADLQFAIYQAPSPLSNCTGSMIGNYRPPCNNGTGSVTTVVSGLTPNVLHIMALDGLTGRKCSWSGITMSNIVLDAGMKFFHAGKGENSVHLEWQTNGLGEERYFEIQKSTDGQHYRSIGTVESLAALGSASNVVNYTFEDLQPGAGTNYYRIRQVNQSGEDKYSAIEQVRFDGNGIFSLSSYSPNPTAKNLNVVLEGMEETWVELRVSDLSGKVVNSSVARLIPGKNELEVETGSLAAGTYLLVVTDGQTRQTCRFVKSGTGN